MAVAYLQTTSQQRANFKLTQETKILTWEDVSKPILHSVER